METATTHSRLTTLEAAVLETLAYSDLFDYPLTPVEVHRWLPVRATAAEVAAALQAGVLTPMLSRVGQYVTLAGREATVATRDRRRDSSRRLGEAAERYGRLIGRLPFVRMVGVTGSLAVDNADPGDDLDYLIVTAPGRVWTVRAMLMTLGRLAALRGTTLCPNYLLAETALALAQQDLYTARELLQMRPVAGYATYRRMLAANPWWRDHLPNAEPHPPTPSPISEMGDTVAAYAASNPARPQPVEARETPGTAHTTPDTLSPSPRRERGPGGEETSSPSPKSERGLGGEVSPLRRFTEAVLRLPPFDALERWILARKGAELRRQAAGPEAVFDETMCKGHAGAWRTRTKDRFEARMQELHAKLQASARGAGTSNGGHKP